ncbi:MAG: hypothetical protein WA936_14210 [Erythrobacter sp.]
MSGKDGLGAQLANGFAIAALGTALLFLFGADAINFLVETARDLGAN